MPSPASAWSSYRVFLRGPLQLGEERAHEDDDVAVGGQRLDQGREQQTVAVGSKLARRSSSVASMKVRAGCWRQPVFVHDLLPIVGWHRPTISGTTALMPARASP